MYRLKMMEKLDKAFNLLKLEQQYTSIKNAVDLTKEYGKPYEELEKKSQRWVHNPFSYYDIERAVKKIRDDVLGIAIGELSKEIPNVKIDEEKIRKEVEEKLGEIGFSVSLTKEIIDRDYVSKAEELSREEILTQAQHLLPVIWVEGVHKQLEPKDILDGRKLLLEVAISDYGFRGEHDYRFNEDREIISAFDKVCGLIAYPKTTYTKIQDSSLTLQLINIREPFYDIIVDDRHIEKVRVYKNRKFIVVFDNEENAKKVAERLLEKV